MFSKAIQTVKEWVKSAPHAPVANPGKREHDEGTCGSFCGYCAHEYGLIPDVGKK